MVAKPPSEGGAPAWPTELRLAKDRQRADGRFRHRRKLRAAAEYLRVMSPSAEVQGHSPDERKTVPGKRDVAILEVQPIGNYAVRLVFDDMHSTGIFSWDYLPSSGATAIAEVAGVSRRAGQQGAQPRPAAAALNCGRPSPLALCTMTVAPTATRS